jgi:hypothetical protein
MKLERSLGECTLSLLRRIAANHGLAVGQDRLRSELVEIICQRFTEPEYLDKYLSCLPPEEMETLRTVRDQGWTAKAFILDRTFPKQSPSGALSSVSRPGPVLSLLQKGLLFRGFAAVASWRGEVYYLPEELQPAVQRALPAPRPKEKVDLRLDHVPATVAERRVDFDLFCLLSFLRREPRRLVNGSLARSDLARLEREVAAVSTDVEVGRWEERWRFLLHICFAAGLVTKAGTSPAPARGVERLLAEGSRGIRDRLLEQYLRDRGWSDLSAAGRVRQPLGGRRVDEAAARRLLVHYLEETRDEGWTDEALFCRWVRSVNADLLREDYSSPAWAMVDASSGAELYGTGSWDAVEGEWIRHILRGPLHWLGLVRWGLTVGGKAEGFEWLGSGGKDGRKSLPDEERKLRTIAVTEKLEVMAPYDTDLGLLYRLEPYLELVRRDGASLYRLTKASVLGGLEKGGSWEELRAMLELLTGEAARGAVVGQVADWASGYGRFILEASAVLTSATPEDAELVLSVPGVGPCLDVRLGARSYRIRPGRVWELVERLRTAGYSPKVDPSAGLVGVRRAANDLSLLKESLFALKLLHSLHPGLELQAGEQAVRRLESVLGPEESAEVARRVQAAAKRMAGG